MIERNSWRWGLTVVLLGVVALGGCARSWKVERLRELEVETVSARDQPLWQRERVLVRRFADLRTDEFARSFASSSIPVVSFVHMGGRIEYPDHSGLYSGSSRHGDRQRIGGLDTELPYLVARALPGDDVFVEDDLRSDARARSFDWIVEGRVLQATATNHASVVLGLLSIIGMPAVFSRQQLRVEVTLRRAGAQASVLSRIYSFDERRAAGLYYHHGASGKLARRSVAHVVEIAAADIVRTVAKQRALELGD
jgi:hypothetical protein